MATTKINMISYLSFALLLSLIQHLFFTSYAAITTSPPPPTPNSNSVLTSEIQKLELLVDKTELELYTKDACILKYEKQMAELTQTIHQLESDLSNIEYPPDYEKVINVFEEQVRKLEAVVRRNDKELQLLKRTAKDSEDTVDVLAAQVKTMAVVIPELWFHIQKLEQAQEVIERRTAELQRYIRNQKCSFFKLINSFGGRRYQEMVAPYIYGALNLLKRSLLAVKKYHHQLQGVVKQEMDKHELTSVLAGEESVFLLVSIIFVSPILLARIWF